MEMLKSIDASQLGELDLNFGERASVKKFLGLMSLPVMVEHSTSKLASRPQYVGKLLPFPGVWF